MWDTLLIKASSPEADNMQKQTQTYAEKVRLEWKGHTRGPPAGGQRSGRENSTGHSGILCQTGTALSNADLRRGTLLQAGQNVQSRHQEKVTLNIVSPEKRLLVLEALSQSESERKYGRAPPTAMERELQAFLEDLLKT